MRYALTAEQALLAERRALEDAGLSLADLMRSAGTAVADRVNEMFPAGRVVVVCGKGNNGGDGWVAAERLTSLGRQVDVFALAVPEDMGSPAREAALAAVGSGVSWDLLDSLPDLVERLVSASVVVDAVLGIGTTLPVREPLASVLAVINDADAPVISVDVPSGVDADTGAADPVAVAARVTVTFSAPKPGIVMYPGAGLAGEVEVADIGIPEKSLAAAGVLEVWETADYAGLLPPVPPEAHKSERGRVLVVGGSRGMSGAPCMAAAAALRSGAGIVTAAVPASLAAIVETKLTEVMTAFLPETPDGTLSEEAVDEVLALSASFDAVVLGPGLSRSVDRSAVRRMALEVSRPLVLDADGLVPFEGEPALLSSRCAPTVLTPHPGEAARLLGTTVAGVQADRRGAAASLAGGSVVCVLKGPRTLVTDGGRVVANITGNAGMATAGSGDVLSGIIGTLLAQGLEPLEAAALGAWLHGKAGDAAAAEWTQRCVVAWDLIEHMGDAMRALEAPAAG